MNLYKVYEIWIIIIAFLVCIRKTKPVVGRVDKSRNVVFIAITAIPLILLTGLRGRNGMGVDYGTYEYIYQAMISKCSFIQLLNEDYIGYEAGFAILNKIVGMISGYNVVVLMTIIAIITVGCYYYMFYQYSQAIWLSLLLLLGVGSYYSAFNTTRQFMAAALFFVAGKYVYEKDIVKYVAAVLLISTIHKSAIVMIPFYWLLNVNWKKKKYGIISFFILVIAFVVLLNVKGFVDIAKVHLYDDYGEGAFGYGKSNISYFALIRPIFFIFFMFLNLAKINLEDRIERCNFNATLYFSFFYIASYQIYIVYRFTYFFLPFILIAVPNLVYKGKNKNNRLINLGLAVAFTCFYMFVGQRDLVYMTFWQ